MHGANGTSGCGLYLWLVRAGIEQCRCRPCERARWDVVRWQRHVAWPASSWRRRRGVCFSRRRPLHRARPHSSCAPPQQPSAAQQAARAHGGRPLRAKSWPHSRHPRDSLRVRGLPSPRPVRAPNPITLSSGKCPPSVCPLPHPHHHARRRQPACARPGRALSPCARPDLSCAWPTLTPSRPGA